MTTALVKRRLSTPVAYLLLIPCLFGLSGLHRFYMGRWMSGLLWLFTGGLCGVGNIIDIFVIPHLVHGANNDGTGW